MSSKRRDNLKISLKENDVISFDQKKNGNIFCRFFLYLADLLLQKLPCLKTQIYNQNHRRVLQPNSECVKGFVLHNGKVTSVEKILKNLNLCQILSNLCQIS